MLHISSYFIQSLRSFPLLDCQVTFFLTCFSIWYSWNTTRSLCLASDWHPLPLPPPPCRKSLCLRSSRWNSPETTVTWRRAATLTASRSSQPPWSTTSGRRTPVRTTVRLWPPQAWAWRWLRAGRRPSDKPWCPSPLSPAWPVLQLRAKITVSHWGRWFMSAFEYESYRFFSHLMLLIYFIYLCSNFWKVALLLFLEL